MKIIPIAEFCGHNKPSNKVTTISVEQVGDQYYFLTESGNRSICYGSLSQAILDIVGVYGKWCGFKLLVEG